MSLALGFTAFNRPHYLEESLKSWRSVRGQHNWWKRAYIEPSPINHLVTEKFDILSRIDVVQNPTKLGVLVNPWNAMDNMFYSGAQFAVLAEDDIVVSEDILEYMEWANVAFAEDPAILIVCAFSRQGGNNPAETYLNRGFSPLVWGTWRDRWYRYLRDTWDKDYSSGKLDGSEAGWDWNINRILQSLDMRTVTPCQSRSDHIGKLGGTHMLPELFESSRGIGFKQERNPMKYWLNLSY